MHLFLIFQGVLVPAVHLQSQKGLILQFETVPTRLIVWIAQQSTNLIFSNELNLNTTILINYCAERFSLKKNQQPSNQPSKDLFD